ncbi:hypothetical protein [Corynebacterium hiratae]|uniref:Uncharacterized protein n=1 Tax=Corynebacterium hiratae TaxID=3139423 RepID=A0A553FPW1_9CORY|nr:hypothetical protein [Corynebacterium aurimucosum]TRX59299.1 hypothetical protein FNY97_11775 [Corynebacterium aurimucosum]
MSTAKVPEIEYAAFDAMKEVASSLKAACLTRAAEAGNEVESQWWIRQNWLVEDMVGEVDATDIEAIRSAAALFAQRLEALSTEHKAA